MTPRQALDLLAVATRKTLADRETHAQIIDALETLRVGTEHQADLEIQLRPLVRQALPPAHG